MIGKFLIVLMTVVFATAAAAQDPGAVRPSQPSGGGGQTTRQGATQGQGESRFLGGEMPVFDPGSDMVIWDGRMWNVNNNRVFEAKIERFLSEPEETSEEDVEYNALLQRIMDLLAPMDQRSIRAGSSRITNANLDQAFALLPQAAAFARDGGLSDSIANQVQSAWLSIQARDRLSAANRSLEEERRRLDWNTRMATQGTTLTSAPPRGNQAASREWEREQKAHRDARLVPLTTRTAEVEALRKANDLKKEISQLQAKIQFQGLLVQLFMQRRFQHVLIGTRFYRQIFSDGDEQFQLGEDTASLFSRTSGAPPTVTTMDALANEVIRDVNEGIKAFKFLLENDELASASKRLSEIFLVGEYLPPVRTLPRELKRQTLQFVQRSNQLVSALEVKDYTLAEQLVKELQETARDFDASKPLAMIETAKTVSAMHLAKAKNAAVSNDRETMEQELRAATEIWPRNPALAEVSGLIFSQADVQQRALIDFDQLLSQKNYRQIFDDRARFIAATAVYPDRAQELQKILEQMSLVEAAIMRAQEIDRRGDSIGAWESVERASAEFPSDTKLNMVRAELTTRAADFVSSLRKAQSLEERGQVGASLAWYLQAQQDYPPSDFAREGIDRIIPQILPEDVSLR